MFTKMSWLQLPMKSMISKEYWYANRFADRLQIGNQSLNSK